MGRPGSSSDPQRGATALKVLALVLGGILSVGLVLSAFFKFDLSGKGPLLTRRFSFLNFIQDIPEHLPWFIPFVLLTAAIIPLRALQWQRTLPKKVPFRERYHMVAIGAFVHNAVPGKLGDIFRSFMMSRTQGMPFVSALGSVGVCKLLEFAALMLLVAGSLMGPFAQTMQQFAGGLRIAAVVCVALVVVVVLLAHYARPMAQALERKDRLPKARGFLTNVADGLGTARSFRGMAVALLFSIPPVLAPAMAYGLALKGLGVPGGLFAGAVVLGAIALGQGTPGIPAGMGIYYFVTSWAARSLGASPEDAAAFSALTHLGTFLTQLSVGAISVWIRKIRWSELRRRKDIALEAAREMTHAKQPLRSVI